MLDSDVQLFALDGTRDFGERVAAHLGLPLSPQEEKEYEDGEHKARPLISVRGSDVYVFHSLYGDSRQSGNDKLCRLLFFIGALKDASAARVTAVVPYLAYARKDRKTKPRDPVTTRYVAAMFEAVRTDAILTMDVHNLSAFQNAFRICADNLEANRLFVHYFLPLVREEEVVVIAPDAGGIKRAERFRQLLSQQLGREVGTAFAEKHRSGGAITGELLVGDVRNKVAIIIDDMVSTGNTLVRTARSCRAQGAASVLAAASHGLFTEDAVDLLAGDAIERLAITDTVPPFRLGDGPARQKLALLSSAALFGDAIRAMHEGGSVSELSAL
nr:ribose-phosphate pyrophosphokinase [Paucimonas lemoignei]